MKNQSYENRIALAKTKLQEAKYILIGAGAGLSTAAGLDYGGKRFLHHFADYHEKYGIPDMYSGMFYKFQTREEEWAYKARHIFVNRYQMGATPLYQDLRQFVEKKDYFVITTNADHQFYLAGFKEDRVYPTQGDYAEFQCSRACHDKLYYNEAQIKQMVKDTKDFRIPTDQLPYCPVCGETMMPHLRADEYFVEEVTFRENLSKYQNYLNTISNQKVVLMEFGVGFNTPGIIRYPFERFTYVNPEYTLIRFNKYHPQGATENIEKTITFSEDIAQILSDLQSNPSNDRKD